MVEVIGLVKDGNEQPQFFMLTIKYPNQGEGYTGTIIFGTEEHLRTVLKDGGVGDAAVDALFTKAKQAN